MDDEDTVRTTSEDFLAELGYEVVCVADGAQAVSYFRDPPDGVDLVLLDMTMPVMDGRRCFAELKNIKPYVKVVLMTGHALDGAAQKTLDEGAQAFLQKPFVLVDLSQVVAQILRRDG